MIFVSVGSMFPFDRLIRLMDEWAEKHPGDEVLAQVGNGTYQPKHMRWQRIFAPNEYKKIVRSCQLIVSHAGTGSVFTASEFRVPVVLMPRRAANKEHTTDHQLDTAKWLEDRPGIFVVWSDADLAPTLECARQNSHEVSVIPRSAPAPFLNRIRHFLLTESARIPDTDRPQQ